MNATRETPDIIRARGEARARELEALARLNWASQLVVTFFDQLRRMDWYAVWLILVFVIVMLLVFFPDSRWMVGK